jgi:thioredoxin-like negative regulator of GroEL
MKKEEFIELQKKNTSILLFFFTASWCGACKRLDLDAIQDSQKDVRWYKCDIDQNKYTLGYCGLKSVPSFCVIKNSKFLGKFSSSDTSMVIEMLNSVPN